MTEGMPAIVINDLRKYFGAGKKEVKAVDGISFSVPRGQIFGFLGKNGAGKTTTIRCLMDFIRPTSGSISILGRDAQVNAVELKHQIGYLSGNVQLNKRWTGQQHIDYYSKINSNARDVQNLITRLSFDPSMKTKQLSSGNRQKLGIILALMHQPNLIILDEPTNALDPLLQQIVYDLLEKARDRGATIFMSSHNLAEVERVCDSVAIIKEGQLVATETIASLSDKHVYTVKARFSQVLDDTRLQLPNTTIGLKDNEHVTLSIKGDIAPILSQLSQLPLEDIEVKHASLEEMFLEYYQN
ncbi:MAG: ABC transporter ATP-binding protein [Patescibacteria group bacterium]